MKEASLAYERFEEPARTCILALRVLILGVSEEISETVKYGGPCFMYKERPLVYLWKDKKNLEPYILVCDGQLIDHPALEAGDRKRMKILRVDPEADIDVGLVEEVIGLVMGVRH